MILGAGVTPLAVAIAGACASVLLVLVVLGKEAKRGTVELRRGRTTVLDGKDVERRSGAAVRIL